MNVLITNTTIVTCNSLRETLPAACMAVIDGRIAAVGPSCLIEPKFGSLEKFDGTGLAVLPGLINAHSHVVLTALKGTVEDWTGDAIYGYMTPVSYVMTPAERSAVALLGCLEAIRSGTTAIVDPFRHVATYGHAMASTGLRLWLSESCADIDTRKIRHGDYTVDPAFGKAFVDRATALVEDFHGAYGDRVRCQVAAHAPDNCSPEMLRTVQQLAERFGITRTIHLSQSTGEEAAVRQRSGVGSVEYLDREGFLGPDLLAAHWTFCSPADIETLARRSVRMAHTPASSSRRGLHKALIGCIRDAGISIALGTDNMSADMFQAMSIGSIVHRTGRGRDQEGGVVPSPQQVLDMATRNGAEAVAAGAEIGSIEVGKKADLTIVDLRTPALRPVIRLTSNLVHYGHPGAVHSVIVDGQFVMRDRKVLTMDEGRVIEDAEQAVRNVWRRMVDANPDIARPRGEIPWLDADAS